VARNTAALIGLEGWISDDAVHIETGYAGPAYGIPSPETVQAIRLMGRLEGILLDLVYEGKAMAGLIAMVRRRLFAPADKILFMHLGGVPALHAYADLFGTWGSAFE
jgi:1-aminocyclopropane-1-carboxylate deaminase